MFEKKEWKFGKMKKGKSWQLFGMLSISNINTSSPLSLLSPKSYLHKFYPLLYERWHTSEVDETLQPYPIVSFNEPLLYSINKSTIYNL